MCRLSFFSLLGVLAVVAGCGVPPELTRPSYNYTPPDPKEGASKFRTDPQANRTVSGEQVPLKFVDRNGKEVDLASFHGKSNVVLVVVKGLPKFPGGLFCPGCLAQVNALTANYDEFKKRNAEVLMVFPGPTDKLPDFLELGKVDGKNGNPEVPFPLLTDKDLKAVASLDIRGDLAKPSTYILDKKGNPVFVYVGVDTYDRPSVKALLAQLDKLNASP